MQHNILKNSNLSSIYLIYNDSTKKKLEVRFRFMDKNDCYLSVSILQNYTKPKKNTSAELVAYTEDGVYRTKVKIKDFITSLNEVLYVVENPKNWEFTQLRDGTRKEYSLPFVLRFNDGFEINSMSHDISTGGISFVSAEPIPNVYKKVSGSLSFSIPQANFKATENNNNNITIDVKFLRMMETNNTKDNCYVYRFINISQDDIDKIKMFLISI